MLRFACLKGSLWPWCEETIGGEEQEPRNMSDNSQDFGFWNWINNLIYGERKSRTRGNIVSLDLSMWSLRYL